MKISLNIGCIGRYWSSRTGRDVPACAKLIKGAGFDALDFDLCRMENENDVLNGDNYREIAEQYRKEIEAEGLYVNQTHTPFHFKDWDNKEYYDNYIFPMVVRSLEITSILGAKIAIVHPIHHLEYAGREEEMFERNMEFYRSLMPYCEKFGIKVATENMWRRDPRRKYIVHDTCSTKEEFARYVDTINSEYMVACLDVGHVGLPIQMDEAHDFVRYLGDRIQALHIHDNNYQGDDHTPPYSGMMNWSELAKALGEIDYNGVFTYEITPKSIANIDDEFLPVTLKYYADIARHLTDIIDRNRPQK